MNLKYETSEALLAAQGSERALRWALKRRLGIEKAQLRRAEIDLSTQMKSLGISENDDDDTSPLENKTKVVGTKGDEPASQQRLRGGHRSGSRGSGIAGEARGGSARTKARVHPPKRVAKAPSRGTPSRPKARVQTKPNSTTTRYSPPGRPYFRESAHKREPPVKQNSPEGTQPHRARQLKLSRSPIMFDDSLNEDDICSTGGDKSISENEDYSYECGDFKEEKEHFRGDVKQEHRASPSFTNLPDPTDSAASTHGAATAHSNALPIFYDEEGVHEGLPLPTNTSNDSRGQQQNSTEKTPIGNGANGLRLQIKVHKNEDISTRQTHQVPRRGPTRATPSPPRDQHCGGAVVERSKPITSARRGQEREHGSISEGNTALRRAHRGVSRPINGGCSWEAPLGREEETAKEPRWRVANGRSTTMGSSVSPPTSRTPPLPVSVSRSPSSSTPSPPRLNSAIQKSSKNGPKASRGVLSASSPFVVHKSPEQKVTPCDRSISGGTTISTLSRKPGKTSKALNKRSPPPLSGASPRHPKEETSSNTKALMSFTPSPSSSSSLNTTLPSAMPMRSRPRMSKVRESAKTGKRTNKSPASLIAIASVAATKSHQSPSPPFAKAIHQDTGSTALGRSTNTPRRGISAETPQSAPSYRTRRKASAKCSAPVPTARNTRSGTPSTVTNASPSMENNSSNPRRKSWEPSSCVGNIDAIRKKRDARRKRMENEKKMLEQEPGSKGDRRAARYRMAIRKFRESAKKDRSEYDQKRSESKLRTVVEDKSEDNSDAVNVFVRKRPLNGEDERHEWFDILTCHSAAETLERKKSVVVHQPGLSVDLTEVMTDHNFSFDHVFSENASNEEVYQRCLAPLVRVAVSGEKNVLCFAYGQTGSGKTYTMSALYRKALSQVFSQVNSKTSSSKGMNPIISLTCFEIYCGQIYDLLRKRKKCTAREDKDGRVHVVGLQEVSVESVKEGMEVLRFGFASRCTGSTAANAHSSRSHALFRIHIEMSSNEVKEDIAPVRTVMATTVAAAAKAKTNVNANVSISRRRRRRATTRTITLVDLAGSERGSERTKSDRKARQEASEINKGLLALKECIRSLNKVSRGGMCHIPFRSSVITHVLQDAFIDDESLLSVIVAVSPGSGSCDHTLNSLRYAARLKGV